MSKLIEMNSCIEVSYDTDQDEVVDKFIEFVESNGWTFGGGFQAIVDDWYVDENGNRIRHVSDNA